MTTLPQTNIAQNALFVHQVARAARRESAMHWVLCEECKRRNDKWGWISQTFTPNAPCSTCHSDQVRPLTAPEKADLGVCPRCDERPPHCRCRPPEVSVFSPVLDVVDLTPDPETVAADLRMNNPHQNLTMIFADMVAAARSRRDEVAQREKAAKEAAEIETERRVRIISSRIEAALGAVGIAALGFPHKLDVRDQDALTFFGKMSHCNHPHATTLRYTFIAPVAWSVELSFRPASKNNQNKNWNVDTFSPLKIVVGSESTFSDVMPENGESLCLYLEEQRKHWEPWLGDQFLAAVEAQAAAGVRSSRDKDQQQEQEDDDNADPFA